MFRLLLPLFACFVSCVPSTPPELPDTPPERIISTLPSITEVLFDIGLGNRIVGDSAYTQYPPEAARIEKIGGHFDLNREKVMVLKPDLIILPAENESLRRSQRVPVLTVDHNTLAGVLDSYITIGSLFGPDVLATAQTKRQELLDQLNAFADRTRTAKPIRTLISLDRSAGTGRIQNLYAAGSDSFLSEAVVLAGGENVAASIGLLAPALSAEGIIHLAPDVIIDIQFRGRDISEASADWQSLGNSVPAVRSGNILVLTDDFASVPGPRTPLLIEKIAQYFDSR